MTGEQLKHYDVKESLKFFFFITCFYGDCLTFSAVAHEVGSYNIHCVVGAALQALNYAGQIHGVAAVNNTAAVPGHGNIENCAAAIPSHRDGISSTFLHR